MTPDFFKQVSNAINRQAELLSQVINQGHTELDVIDKDIDFLSRRGWLYIDEENIAHAGQLLTLQRSTATDTFSYDTTLANVNAWIKQIHNYGLTLNENRSQLDTDIESKIHNKITSSTMNLIASLRDYIINIDKKVTHNFVESKDIYKKQDEANRLFDEINDISTELTLLSTQQLTSLDEYIVNNGYFTKTLAPFVAQQVDYINNINTKINDNLKKFRERNRITKNIRNLQNKLNNSNININEITIDDMSERFLNRISQYAKIQDSNYKKNIKLFSNTDAQNNIMINITKQVYKKYKLISKRKNNTVSKTLSCTMTNINQTARSYEDAIYDPKHLILIKSETIKFYRHIKLNKNNVSVINYWHNNKQLTDFVSPAVWLSHISDSLNDIIHESKKMNTKPFLTVEIMHNMSNKHNLRDVINTQDILVTYTEEK